MRGGTSGKMQFWSICAKWRAAVGARCLSICLSLHLSVSICLSICLSLSVSLSGCVAICLSLSFRGRNTPFICLSLHLSVSVPPSICLSLSLSEAGTHSHTHSRIVSYALTRGSHILYSLTRGSHLLSFHYWYLTHSLTACLSVGLSVWLSLSRRGGRSITVISLSL